MMRVVSIPSTEGAGFEMELIESDVVVAVACWAKGYAVEQVLGVSRVDGTVSGCLQRGLNSRSAVT